MKIWFRWKFRKFFETFINFRIMIKTQKGAIIIHDCIYQFVRIFYHSRFKPLQLEMTATQLLAPILDLVLTLPLIIRLFNEFSRFSNETKMRYQTKPEINEWSWWSLMMMLQRTRSVDLLLKFLLYSHIYLSSVACLIEPDGRIRLTTLYHAKVLRKNLNSEIQARDAQVNVFILLHKWIS